MLDVSNYTGYLDIKTLHNIPQTDLCVRLSTETSQKRDIAIRQLQAGAAANKRLHGYGWAYWDADPVRSVNNWLRVAHLAEVTLHKLWVDCEDTIVEPVKTALWIRKAVEELDIKRQPCGIYTRRDWWDNIAAYVNLSSYSLWTAQYDGIPSLHNVVLYGGWKAVYAKQFTGETGSVPFLAGESILRS